MGLGYSGIGVQIVVSYYAVGTRSSLRATSTLDRQARSPASIPIISEKLNNFVYVTCGTH